MSESQGVLSLSFLIFIEMKGDLYDIPRLYL